MDLSFDPVSGVTNTLTDRLIISNSLGLYAYYGAPSSSKITMIVIFSAFILISIAPVMFEAIIAADPDA